MPADATFQVANYTFGIPALDIRFFSVSFKDEKSDFKSCFATITIL